MSFRLLVLLGVIGVISALVGVALIHPPAALILFGVVCVVVALVTEVPET